MKPPPKPELVAMATFLRAELNARGWSVINLNEHLGLKRNATAVYPWLNGTSPPREALVVRLEKLFPDAPKGIFYPKASVKMEDNVVPMLRTTRSNNPLQFNVMPDGAARLQLDITGPLDELSVLLRMLLDQSELLRK